LIVWYKGLFYKLLASGVGHKTIDIIQNMYSETQSSLKMNNSFTSFFNINRGIHQGDSLRPTLFNIDINDISDLFLDKNCDPLILEKSNIGSLMFAVDLLVLSESKEGLQESLNKLLTYCNKWQLSVNYKKTKTMTIGSLNRKPKPNFTYNNNLLENVNEFKFLGNVISQNGNFVSSSEALSKKALKVMYSIKSYMCSLNELPVTVSTHLFDSLDRPILTYCEIWNMDTYKAYYNATWRVTKSNSQVDYCRKEMALHVSTDAGMRGSQ
jgi:hypothetical protein